MKYISSFLLLLLVIVGFLPAASIATDRQTKSILKSIEYIGEKGAGELIKVELTRKVIPRLIKLSGKSPRLVFDFPEAVKSKDVANSITADGKIIKRIRVGIHNQPEVKIRVVIDLVANVEYKVSHGYEETDSNMFILVSTEQKGVEKKQELDSIAEKTKESPQPPSTITTPVKKKQNNATVEEVKTAEKTEVLRLPPTEKKIAKTQSDLEKKPQTVSTADKQAKKQAEHQETDDRIGTKVTERVISPEKKKASLPAEQVEQVTSPVAVEEGVSILEEQTLDENVADENIADENIADITDDEIPVLLNISFERSTNDKELVLFKLSGFHPPVVFSTESQDLLVVCDFLEGVLGYGIDKNIETNGRYISKVEVSKHKDPEKVRVVLHLDGSFRYDLKQVFFKEDNLFVVMISNLGEKE